MAKKICQHFFVVKKKTTHGFFSGTTVVREIYKTMTDRKKATKLCKDLSELTDPFDGVYYYVWNGKSDIGKSDPLYGKNTGPG